MELKSFFFFLRKWDLLGKRKSDLSIGKEGRRGDSRTKFEFSAKNKVIQRILRIDTRADQFRNMSPVAEKQKNWFYEGSIGSRNFAGESDKSLNREVAAVLPFLSVFLQSDVCFFLLPHDAKICFCVEDIFNYTVQAKEKHNGILTRLLFLCRQIFRNISILVIEGELENTTMCIKNLSPFLGLSNRTVFQKHHVILYSRQCF